MTQIVFLAVAGLPAPRLVATATPARTLLAGLHRHPTYNLSFRIIVVDHITQLSVSHSKEIWLQICKSMHIYNRIYFELSTFFGQPADA